MKLCGQLCRKPIPQEDEETTYPKNMYDEVTQTTFENAAAMDKGAAKEKEES